MMRAGFPATRQFDGTSFITTLAAATTQLSPTLMPAMMMLFAPILHCFADPRIRVNAARGVVGENAGAEIDRRAFADMDAARVAFVQFGRKRDRAPRADIHSPNLNEIEAAQFPEEGPELAAHDRQGAGGAQVG